MIEEEKNKSHRSIFLGIIGAILFSLICPLDWLITNSFGVFGGILPILVPVAAFIGFRLFYGRINKTVLPKALITVGIVFFVMLLLTWYCFVCKEVFLSVNEYQAEKGLSKISYFGVLFDFKLVFSNVSVNHLSVLLECFIFGLIEFVFEIIGFRKMIAELRKYSQSENGTSSQNEQTRRKPKGNIAVGVIIASLTAFVLATIWFLLDIFKSSFAQIAFCGIVPLFSLLFYRLYARRLVMDKWDMPRYIAGEVISAIISIIVVILTWQSLFSIHVYANYVYWFKNGWVTSVPSLFDCFRQSVRNTYYEICYLNDESVWTMAENSIFVLVFTFMAPCMGLTDTLHAYYIRYIYDMESWGIHMRIEESRQKKGDVEGESENTQQNTENIEISDVNNDQQT